MVSIGSISGNRSVLPDGAFGGFEIRQLNCMGIRRRTVAEQQLVHVEDISRLWGLPGAMVAEMKLLRVAVVGADAAVGRHASH